MSSLREFDRDFSPVVDEARAGDGTSGSAFEQ